MILETREYFAKNYRHINLRGLSDKTIQEFLNKDYIKYLTFNQKKFHSKKLLSSNKNDFATHVHL